jgi:hypothetical protein
MQSLWKIPVGWLAALLWLASVALAMVEIVVVRELVMRFYALLVNWINPAAQRYGPEFWSALSLRNFVVLILALLVLIFAVATGEYHARRVGTRSSWKLFAWSFGVELAILLLAYFI